MKPASQTPDCYWDVRDRRERKGLVKRLLIVDAWMTVVLRGTAVAILEGFALCGMAHAAIPMPEENDRETDGTAGHRLRGHRQAMEQLRALASIQR